MWEFIWYECSAVCELSAWWLYGGVNGDFLQEGLCYMLCDPGLLQQEPLPLWQATADLCLHRRYSNTPRPVWLSLCGVSGCSVHKVLFQPSKHLWWVWGLILDMIFPLLPSCWGFSFALGHGVSFFGGIQHSPVNGCSSARCNFEVLTGEDEHTSFYSTILLHRFDGAPSCSVKASLDNNFDLLHFFFLGIVLINTSCTMLWTSIHSSSGTLPDS